MGYIIYIDDLMLELVSNFFFEFILLWATAEVTGSATTRSRLALGSLVGTSHHLLFILASYRLIPFYGLLRSFPFLLLVSILMILTSFYPNSKGKKLLKIMGYLYAIGFISGGAGMAAGYLFGTPTSPQTTVSLLVSIAVILIIGELGWGIVQKRIYHHIYQLPIQIVLADKQVRIMALIDTGNKLKDPLTKKPVIVAELHAVKPLFDHDTSTLLEKLCVGQLNVLSEHMNDSLNIRLRIIPFNAIGKEKGMLIGFRPDQVNILTKKQQLSINDVVVAVYPKNLDPESDYHALIPPELVSKSSEVIQHRNNFQRGEKPC